VHRGRWRTTSERGAEWVECALPSEKGAFSREESDRGYRKGGGGEGTGRGSGVRRGNQEGANARHLSYRPFRWVGNYREKDDEGGGRILQPLRDCRQRKSSLPLSRFSFIDTRGFVL